MTRDPIGYVDGANIYRAYFVPNRTDATGTTAIECTCYEGWFFDRTEYTTRVDCSGLASNCCENACEGRFTGRWKIVGAQDDAYIGPDEGHCLWSCQNECWSRYMEYWFGRSYIQYGRCMQACESECAGYNTDAGYQAGEIGFGVGGGGYSQVVCCDETRNVYRVMSFLKICVGGMAGITVGGGWAYLGKEGCDPESYSGWFVEVGGTAGPISGGIDVGLEDRWAYLPGPANGTIEIGGGMSGELPGLGNGGGSKGIGVKGALCRYQFVGEYWTDRCCGE